MLTLIQGINLIARALYAGLTQLIVFPFYKISKKLFGRAVIKVYGTFIIIRGKIRSDRKARFYSILTHNYTIHATIIVITLGIFISNVTLYSKKTLAADNADSRPALFSLINSEFAEDEELVIETFSGSEFVSQAEEDYLKNLSSVRVQPQLEIKSIEESDLTETDNIVQGGSAVVSPNIAKTKKVQRERKTIVYHTVQPNDTISTISQQYDVSVATILWENDLNSYSIIRPGQRLAILPISGISYTVAKGDTITAVASKYDIEQEEILEFNNIIDSSYLKIGQKVIIPGGQKKYVAPTATQYSGLDALRSLVTPKSAQPAPGNKMNWPTEGHRITQYYNWQHYAVDIANKIGTSIYAADAGTVESAGWGTGYGNQILIDHGGGKKTRYAHASKLFVVVGDEVAKGQTIAAMGSTGNSTGSHLHFEVIINGRKYNPLDYTR